ncbi:hypothetical protein C8R43DRAFT_962780 [Mycena crocata]|nr:hypothetical protein C8R43DRAFT_962780 [Mycena crocata]
MEAGWKQIGQFPGFRTRNEAGSKSRFLTPVQNWLIISDVVRELRMFRFRVRVAVAYPSPAMDYDTFSEDVQQFELWTRTQPDLNGMACVHFQLLQTLPEHLLLNALRLKSDALPKHLMLGPLRGWGIQIQLELARSEDVCVVKHITYFPRFNPSRSSGVPPGLITFLMHRLLLPTSRRTRRQRIKDTKLSHFQLVETVVLGLNGPLVRDSGSHDSLVVSSFARKSLKHSYDHINIVSGAGNARTGMGDPGSTTSAQFDFSLGDLPTVNMSFAEPPTTDPHYQVLIKSDEIHG